MSALCARAAGPFQPRTGLPMNTVIVPEAVEPESEAWHTNRNVWTPKDRDISGLGRKPRQSLQRIHSQR